MRVLVIGDHYENANHPFAAELIASAWKSGAKHVDVAALPMASTPKGAAAVWQYHAIKKGGFPGTAFVNIELCGQDWHGKVAREVFDAVNSSIGRVVVATPRYSFPDAGTALLANLVSLIEPNYWDSQEDPSTLMLENPQRFHDALTIVSGFLSGVDLVIGYTENMPLTGMHGMSGTAALLGDLGQEASQDRERIVAGLLFGLAKIGSPHRDSPSASLLSGHSEVETYRELARHDAAGSAGGAAFMLLAAGARALPLTRILSAQFDLPQEIGQSDLIVVNQQVLDGRTLELSILGVVTKLALNFAVPVIAITQEQIMSTRELASNGVSACYVIKPEDLETMSVRLAASWTPQR